MEVRLWMGMRKQPNIKTFWAGEDDVFHCPKISGLFTRKPFETLSKCLHLTNMDDGMVDRNSPNFDKVDDVGGSLMSFGRHANPYGG